MNKSPNIATVQKVTQIQTDTGEFTQSVESVNVSCYVDFSNNLRKYNKDSENVIERGKIFITNKKEIAKVIFEPTEIIINSESYNVLNFEQGQRHIEITI